MITVASVHVGGVAVLLAQDQVALVRTLGDLEARVKRLRKALSQADQTYSADLAAAEIEGIRVLASVAACFTRAPL